jgi:glutamyl-Q tRNA(Asp) synthetase
VPAYTGRFAPTPSGPLHAGSLVAALASWLDARAHGGLWLVRIEDVDTPRCQAGADDTILAQLHRCGLVPDAPPVWQSQRSARYQSALDGLIAQDRAYGCACTRQEIATAWAAQNPNAAPRARHAEQAYPGTCRPGLHGRTARAWRFKVYTPIPALSTSLFATNLIRKNSPTLMPVLQWKDRRLGAQGQDVAQAVGDFVLKRADGLWAYQLAVVVDDAAQGVTHVVRGEDLTDNTARQILLQRVLGVATPAYLHTPLVRAADGEKLSKQHGAPPLDLTDPAQAVRTALTGLGLTGAPMQANLSEVLAWGVVAWSGHLVSLTMAA